MNEIPLSPPGETTSGVRSVLSLARVYRLAQRAVGATRFREVIATQLAGLAPGERVLDVGCGTADILDHLPRGVVYVGYDTNPRYIESARRRFGTRAEFYDAIERIPDLAKTFDLVMAIGVLHHLSDSAVRELARAAHGALRDGGRFLTIDPTLVPGQSRIARLMIRNDRGRHVRSPDALARLLDAAFPGVHTTVRHDLLRVPYSHVIARSERAPARGTDPPLERVRGGVP